MESIWQHYKAAVVAISALIVAAFSSLFIVSESERH